MRSVSFLFVVFPLALTLWMVSGNVVLIGNNVTLPFDDIEANFSPRVQGSGECGVLHLAEPLDACSELTNKVERVSNTSLPYVLIVRGGCSFVDKVRKAQKAGFKAAIVYNNEDNGVLVSMAGNSAGVKIHAVFVSGASGQILMNYAGLPDLELWIIPSFGNSAWSIMAIPFISLLAMSAVLATCFFVRRHQIRRERPRASHIRQFHGMSSRLVKEMPSQIFTSAVEDSCTSMTCAICLEDYSVGEKLRILPCHHKFHAFCVDSWLTTWRTFCPVCKRDVRTTAGDPTASESTPLLSSSPASVASSALSSFRSSLASSSAIQMLPASPVSLSVPRTHSFTGFPYAQQSLRSYRQSPSMSMSQSSIDLQNASSQRLSPSMSVSQSSVDLQNAASQRPHYSHLVSPHSSGYPSLIPTSSRYMSPYIRSPSYASLSLISSSGYQLKPLRCSESAASFSPFASAHSLPES